MEASSSLRLSMRMDGSDHAYVVGDQHTSDKRYFKLPFATRVYILQNEAGAVKWPVTPELEKEIENSLRSPLTSLEEQQSHDHGSDNQDRRRRDNRRRDQRDRRPRWDS